MGTRAAAVQGALNLASGPCAPSEIYGIDRARLEEEVARSAAHGASLALKTAKKVESDARAWDEYVLDMSIVVCNYPTVEQVVGFGAWLSRRRQRACLAQRTDEVPVLTGVQRRTARNMMSELIKHAWPRRWASFAALDKPAIALYTSTVMDRFDALHGYAAQAAAAASGGEGAARAAHLRAQTAPATTRKHFYKTEVEQVQDVLLGETVKVNLAIALGAAAAIMQTTAARSGADL